MQIINDTQLAILEALARFQYMTTAQMMDWGVTRNKRHLYAVLQDMVGKTSSPVKKMNYGAIASVGRLHAIYHLSRKGADILQTAGTEVIQYPSKPVMFTRDYFHRIGCIDIQIKVALWANENSAEVIRHDTYYEHTGRSIRGHPAPKTTIRWGDGQLTPDAVTEIKGHDGTSRLCAIEFHRGRDMLRLDKQVLQYQKAIETATLENAYDYPAAARVLLIYSDATALETSQKRLQKLSLPAPIAQRFFLKSLDGFKQSFLHDWQMISGVKTLLF